jgi:hypothetical protein
MNMLSDAIFHVGLPKINSKLKKDLIMAHWYIRMPIMQHWHVPPNSCTIKLEEDIVE